MKRLIAPLILGVGGIAILISLGTWQLRRLEWKEGILAEIEARIAADPVILPTEAWPETDRYLPVTFTGQYQGADQGPAKVLRVLASRKQIGAGYRLITAAQGGDRRILVDLGFVQLADAIPALPNGPVQLTGNLHWPDETDKYTPAPERDKDLWFARDVGAMAAELNTEPVMLVLRQTDYDSGAIIPVAVGTEGIPNDHRGYAITWFSLAFIWLVMTGYLLYRIRKTDKGEAI